ncbi:MAG: hypothetical protein EOP49_45295, partial [Sphingobacteriales bacterium]
MTKKLYFLFASCLLLLISSCASEDQVASQPFVAAFEQSSYNYRDIPESREMLVVFSQPASANGTVTIEIESQDANYGVDFATTPEASGMIFTLPIISGQRNASFLFRNLVFPFNSDDKVVKFKIVSIDYPGEHNIQGYTTSTVSFGESLGGVATPSVGGPNQGNQVYVDLSSDTFTQVRRDSWDLGFYCGEEFRIGLNASIYMAAKKLDQTNIDQVTQAMVSPFFAQVGIGTFDPENMNYVDDPSGAIGGTAIDEVSINDAENHVYLVNMGYTIGTMTPV